MSNFSIIAEINSKLISLEPKFAKDGILISKVKDIPYGVQIIGEDSTGATGKANCYFSKKKGLSITDSSKNDISKKMVAIFYGRKFEADTYNRSKKFRAIIGTDEAGKGDFFGPLVTAGFFIETEKMEQEILDLGIKDSKKLKDAKIKVMAKQMRDKWPDHFIIVGPSVEKYNELYSNIKNLNKLLGWMHGRVIADLFSRFRDKGIIIKTAVVDKFGDKKNVVNSVGGLDDIHIEAVVRGEEAEVAIAAASVIARDAFLSKMYFLSKDNDMTLPLGASAKVDAAGRVFIKRFGRDNLYKVAKTHFKTMNKL